MARNILYDIPRSAGVQNMIDRARRVTEFKWMPTQELYLQETRPGVSFLAPRCNGKAPEKPEEQIGIPYSSARIANKFVGTDITFDTFLTAAQNPASVLYQRNNGNFYDPNYNCRIGNTFFYYGIVCSTFADYVYDLPIHRCTYEWGCSQEFYEIQDGTADCLQLGDSLLINRPDGTVGGHVSVVTGIGRDEQGKVRQVQISEGTEPRAKSTWYTAGEFSRTLLTGGGTNRVFRYRYLDSVRPPESMLSQSKGELKLNYGDYSGYLEGETIEINICVDADTLIIQGTDTKQEIPFSHIGTKTILGNEYRMYCVDDLKPDVYTAYCMRNGYALNPVHFLVCGLPEVKLTDDQGNEYDKIPLRPVDPDGKPLTKESACFFNEDGTRKQKLVQLAFADGQRLLPAWFGIREQDGELVLRPAATLYDKNGGRLLFFKAGEDVTFYAYRAKPNSLMQVHFTDGQQCRPDYISWTEERVICYNQALLTANDRNRGYAETFVQQYQDNQFANLLLYCLHDFGMVATQPITFVLD